MYDQKDMHIQGPQINQFNNVAPRPIPRSVFKRDFPLRTTFDSDYLIPIFLEEVLPGDEIKLGMTAFCRLATPIKPIMDNLYLETFWFFCPNRLVWTNWQKFQGQQTNPGDSVAYTIPVLDKTLAPLSTTGFTEQSVYDYFGMPTKVTSLASVSCLFNRAYDLIWNEWFRDENLENSLTVATGDGPDDPSIYALRKRNKRKDYFTSCTPWPQKGNAVTINIGGEAPVHGKAAVLGAVSLYSDGSAAQKRLYYNAVDIAIGNNAGTYATDGMYADLGAANPISINTLRQAALYQQILELDARGGTRYVEAIYARFGVVSPDFRLQRPELIGQGSTRINVYAVPQTAPTVSGQTPQGNMAAFGTAAIQGNHGCHYSATEHGMIVGLANVRADLTYQQGLPRMFTRSSRLDFYEPLLNGLGEQTVFNQEIYAQGTSADTQAFGYQERFAEYRFRPGMITGKFRSNTTGPLDYWHLSQKFAALPGLNSTFITEAVPMDRVVAVTTEPKFLMDCSFDYTHVRPMPIRSNPGIARL